MVDERMNPERETLRDRRILIAMTGSIACCKACGVVSGLVQHGASVRVMMTRNAARFVTPLTLEAMTGASVPLDMFEDAEPERGEGHIHIDLARFAEVLGVIPATANIIGKLAGGIADDLVSTTILSSTAPVLVAPAMNRALYGNRIVQDNIRRLSEMGYTIVEPDAGYLSCGEIGPGRLPEREVLIDELIDLLRQCGGLEGMKVLVSAGRTEEPFDPVRFLTNRSSGKMGYALARAACRFGAEVTLVSGPTELHRPRRARFIAVRSAAEMADVLEKEVEDADILFMAAAVCDFTPASYSEEKVRREEPGGRSPLRKTGDTRQGNAGARRGRKPRVGGFAM